MARLTKMGHGTSKPPILAMKLSGTGHKKGGKQKRQLDCENKGPTTPKRNTRLNGSNKKQNQRKRDSLPEPDEDCPGGQSTRRERLASLMSKKTTEPCLWCRKGPRQTPEVENEDWEKNHRVCPKKKTCKLERVKLHNRNWEY